MVFDILEEERNRLIALKEKYGCQISALPKGSLSRKRRWKREYIYLAYREGDKIQFDYVGPVNSKAAKELSEKIDQRKELEKKLQQVEKNLKDIERGLRGKR
jgi:chromosome segregation ATPase